jgi:hypothetical protein
MMRYFVLVFFCLITLDAGAQSSQQIEADLLRSFKKINAWGYDSKMDVQDSLWHAKKIVGEKLYNYAIKYPSTITYNFSRLKKEHVDINTSDDGLFRIYSWDTWTGGTMHWFENVFQYRVSNKTYAVLDTPRSEGDVRPSYNGLYTLKANGHVYYLALNTFIGSTIDVGGSIQVFDIENGKLNDSVRLIRTAAGLHSHLNFEFYLDKSKESLWPSITYDTQKQIISIPLIDANGAATTKHILYKFTGQYFERVKN